MSLILVGDIGGTKTTFVLYDYSEQSPQCINQLTYTSHDFNQFNDILVHLMNKMGINTIDILSLSIAGPILNNECHTTNLPWHISANTIHQAIKVDQIILLNDIEATGYGLLALSNEDLIQINPNKNNIKGDARCQELVSVWNVSLLYLKIFLDCMNLQTICFIAGIEVFEVYSLDSIQIYGKPVAIIPKFF